jgi:two-component system response regulator
MTNMSDLTFVMVDDNPDDIYLTRRQVRRDGIVNNFLSERKPEMVFQLLRELKGAGVAPHQIVVLMDIKMPRSSGFDILRQLREDDQLKDVNVIMLSSSNDESDLFDAIDLGANGYVVKPFKADEFFAALTNVPNIKYHLVTEARAAAH